MQEIIDIKNIFIEYLDRNSNYKEQYALALFRFYESDMPYQLAFRMSGSFAGNQFNHNQCIEGEITLDVALGHLEDDSLRVDEDMRLVDLCEYLSWFSYLSNDNRTLKIVPIKSVMVKNSNTTQAILTYKYTLVRKKDKRVEGV